MVHSLQLYAMKQSDSRARQGLVDRDSVMKFIPSTLILISGIVLIMLSLGHTFAGWPPTYISLTQSDISPEFVRALWAGWHLAGAAMFGFGLILIATVVHTHRGHTPYTVPLFIIAATLTGFGSAGLVLIEFTLPLPSLIFLGFLVIGLLLGLGAHLLRRSSSSLKSGT